MPGPTLTTGRLELWPPAATDLDSLHALTEDEETRRFLGGLAPDRGNSFARLLRNGGSWSLYGYGTFMVRLKGQQAIIGNCGVFRSWRGLPGLDDVPEAGWIIHRDHRGRGVAGEAMQAALDWFDATHGKQRVGCMIDDGNAASQRLAAVLGFVEYHRQPATEGRDLVLYERR